MGKTGKKTEMLEKEAEKHTTMIAKETKENTKTKKDLE